MQKLTVLVSVGEQDRALERLHALGVVHVHAVRTPAAEDLHGIESEIADVDRALSALAAPDGETAEGDPDVAREQVPEILSLVQEREGLSRELEELRDQDVWFEAWGAVSLASLEALKGAGLLVRFYVADRRAIATLPEDCVVRVFGEDDRGMRLAHFSELPGERLDLQEDPMPQVEVGEHRARMAEIEEAVGGINHSLRAFSAATANLHAYRAELERKLEFGTVKHGMGAEGAIAYLQGFCPEEDTDAVRRAAGEEGWAYAIQEPDDPRDVPTLIRTPRWVRIINPVFSFMGTVPGYQEFDISFWFLLFFSLFYAMLVGDGGYGLIFLGLTLFAHSKAKDAPIEPFALMYILSLGTIGWGAISGTWFGMEQVFEIQSLAFLKGLVIQPIASVGGDQMFMMYMCFVIGAIHLSIAHGIIALRHIKSPVGLSQVGWIAIIWALFYVARVLVLHHPSELMDTALTLLGAGVALVLLFANFQKNIIKGVLVSLGDLPLSVISSFSDVVSYLRLFAVGFATFIVASSFNGMVPGAGSFVEGLISAVILFLGHGINIILALMAVVVHGIRLNMLEFSGHLNMQWSGKPYRPFGASTED